MDIKSGRKGGLRKAGKTSGLKLQENSWFDHNQGHFARRSYFDSDTVELLSEDAANS